MKFTKKILENEAVLLHEERDVPVTTVMIATKYGAVNENEENKGIAHFLEHLCFKGTSKRTAEEIAKAIEKIGGELNAFTSEEITAYYAKVPSHHLELAVDVMLDIYTNPTFPPEEVEKERQVILEELKMYKDSPGRHTLEKIKEQLYEKPFGMGVGGTPENIKRITREEIKEMHDLNYNPENTIISVVGKNSLEDVEQLIKKHWTFKEKNVKEGLGEIEEIKEINKEEKEIRTTLEQSHIAIGIHYPKAEEKERYSAEIYSAILGEGMSSRLSKEVREKRGLVYTVRSMISSGKNYGYMIIYAGTDKTKIDEVKKIALEEYGKMKELTEEELEEGKEQVIGNYKIGMEGSRSTAINLISEEIYGKAENYYEYEEKIREVNLEDVRKLAEKTKHSTFVLTA